MHLTPECLKLTQHTEKTRHKFEFFPGDLTPEFSEQQFNHLKHCFDNQEVSNLNKMIKTPFWHQILDCSDEPKKIKEQDGIIA
jgi:hypothetical protein